MRTFWVLTLGLVALAAAEGCKQKAAGTHSGPKAGMAVHVERGWDCLVPGELG